MPRSTRDRDRLRQFVLESLGWKIHRIWSTAWFRAPEAEIEAVRVAIEEAKIETDGPAVAVSSGKPKGVYGKQANVVGNLPQPQSSIPGAPSYVLAELEVDLGFSDLHAVSLDRLSQWLAQVVAVESPIHWLEAARRIANAAGVQRVGSRIQEAFKRACRSGARAKRFVYRGEFLWADESLDPVVRDRSELSAQYQEVGLCSSGRDQICHRTVCW